MEQKIQEIILFASLMDEHLVKEFSLNVQKLIEFGVKVAVVTCNRALQRRSSINLEERDLHVDLNQNSLTEDSSPEFNNCSEGSGNINFISDALDDNSIGSFVASNKAISVKSKSSVYLENVVSTLRQVGIEVSLRSSFPQSFVIIDKKIAWFALNPLGKAERNSIFIRIDSPIDVQDLLEIANQR